jgi:hypothetical protein
MKIISTNINAMLTNDHSLGAKIILPHTLEFFIKEIQTSKFEFLFTFSSIIIGSLSLFLYFLRGIILTEYILWVEKHPHSSRLSILPLLLLVILVSYSPAFTYLRHATLSADALTDT